MGIRTSRRREVADETADEVSEQGRIERDLRRKERATKSSTKKALRKAGDLARKAAPLLGRRALYGGMQDAIRRSLSDPPIIREYQENIDDLLGKGGPTLEEVEQLFNSDDSGFLEDIINDELREIEDIIKQLDKKAGQTHLIFLTND